jgi:uncharacterized protein VirK/YbjX
MSTLKSTFAPTVRLIHQITASRNGGWRRTLWKARQAFLILCNLVGHRQLSRVLTRPNVVNFTQLYPKLLYKYLWEDYLVHGLHRDMRLAALTRHYAYLADRVDENFFVTAYEDKHLLWEEAREEGHFRIALSFPRKHDYEGDLRITFERDGFLLYWMLFNIVPGHLVGSEESEAFLVTALQGASQKIDLIRDTTKLFDDTSLAHLLLAALEGLAGQLQISRMAGVGTAQQVQRQMSRNDVTFRFDYDEFWGSFIGDKAASGFYMTALPFPQKPIEEIKHKHRSRARRRRALKQQISEQVRLSSASFCKPL